MKLFIYGRELLKSELSIAKPLFHYGEQLYIIRTSGGLHE